MDILQIKKNFIPVSRASTAIYLILKNTIGKGNTVLVPANICYAAIYPILYTDNQVSFCDTDPQTGNITYSLFIRAVSECSEKISATILPHMYGKRIDEQDIRKIQKYCNSNGIILIEDCASAMGAEYSDRPAGAWGDYTVYSTGYSKTIDLGFGGLLISNNPIDKIKEDYERLPYKNAHTNYIEARFTKLYRAVRNGTSDNNILMDWNYIRDNCSEVFLHKLSEKDTSSVISGIRDLDNVIQCRINIYHKYRDLLSDTSIRILEYGKGDVPWRFSAFFDPERKKYIIKKMLDNNMRISDWYPVVTPVFNIDIIDDHNKIRYPGAYEMEKSIINFPIPNTDEEINRICSLLKKTIKEYDNDYKTR